MHIWVKIQIYRYTKVCIPTYIKNTPLINTNGDSGPDSKAAGSVLSPQHSTFMQPMTRISIIKPIVCRLHHVAAGVFFIALYQPKNGRPDLPVISKHPFLAGTHERRRQIFCRTGVFLIGTATFTKAFNLHQNLSPFLGNECGIGSLQEQSPPPTPSNNP